MSSRPSLDDLVDLTRYPLADDAAFAPILEHCRRQIRTQSFAEMPGFLKSSAANVMTQEILDALPRAYRREREFSAYEEADDAPQPEDHPRRRIHKNRQFVVTTDVLPADGAMRALYDDDLLTRRIGQLLDEPALYRLADPVMACTSTVMYDGDTHGWHFDLNDFVVSILLQAPDAGGTFDFAPNIRADNDENYAAVGAVMDGSSALTQSIRVQPGTLLLFCGRRAIHRVAPIRGPVPRVIALFSYDRRPDVCYDSDVYQRVVGRRTVYGR